MKKDNIKDNIAVIISIGLWIGFGMYIARVAMSDDSSHECPPTDYYREQQYNEIKMLYDHDEALLRYGKKIDSGTRMLPLEYTNFNS